MQAEYRNNKPDDTKKFILRYLTSIEDRDIKRKLENLMVERYPDRVTKRVREYRGCSIKFEGLIWQEIRDILKKMTIDEFL